MNRHQSSLHKGVHPKKLGIASHRDEGGKGGAGTYELSYKVSKTHFIVILSDEGKDQVTKIRQLKDKDAMELELSENVPNELAIDEIYVEKVGSTASKQQLEVAFGTTDKAEIVRKILVNGKFH